MFPEKTLLTVPTVDFLANQFSQLLRLTLTDPQMDMVVKGNKTETNPNVCHSGDFCDSNMVLHEVFMRYGMDVADEGGVNRWADLWNKVWDRAKARDFLMFKCDDVVEIIEEFQGIGDGTLIWVVKYDEEDGRVDLVPFETLGVIRLLHMVDINWLRLRYPEVQ